MGRICSVVTLEIKCFSSMQQQMRSLVDGNNRLETENFELKRQLQILQSRFTSSEEGNRALLDANNKVSEKCS